jgi:RNA polymerase primary sigma factor
VGAEGQRALTDLLSDDAPPPDDVVTQAQLQAQITRALEGLPEREQHVLRLRYGLAGGHARTLDEAGAALCVSRERIRQIEYRALRRLRGSPHRHLLSAFLH